MNSSTRDITSRMKHQAISFDFIFYCGTLAPPAGKSQFAELRARLAQNSVMK